MPCVCLAKPFLVVVNLVFVLIGLALLSAGIILKVSPELVSHFVDPFLEELPELADHLSLDTVEEVDEVDGASDLESTGDLYESAAIVLIALGTFFFVIGLLGCWGSCYSVKCMIVLYMILIGILLVAKLTILILLLAGIFTDEIKNEIQKTIDKEYGGIDDVSSLESVIFNYVMIEFECCGIDGYQDFNNTENWKRERNVGILDQDVFLITPIACCKFSGSIPDVDLVDEQCMLEPMKNNSNFDKGCWVAVGERIETEEIIVLAVYGAILIFELVCIIFAAFIYCDLERQNKRK